MSSTCGKCGGHRFEIEENSPENSKYKIFMVQCTSCGCVVGATEYYDSGVMLVQQEKTLRNIADGVNNCLSRINALEYELKRQATSTR